MSATLLVPAASEAPSPLAPSVSQRAAIEAALGPVLVLAGPGAGKTFCLIERIRFLIERQAIDPARICAFTFTNKAAEEIATRLERDLGVAGRQVRRGTVHAFCAELLREFGSVVRLRRGFGIADEPYQKALLGRMGVPARRQAYVLQEFSIHRLRGTTLRDQYIPLFEKYTATLAKRNLVDFDGLVVKAREVLEHDATVAGELRSRWQYVLVDEFQDLNKSQYAVIQALVRDHRNIFAVGDDEQSIFSWTGAEPQLFATMLNDFGMTSNDRYHHLRENHRCPREAFALARRLVALNAPVLVRSTNVEAPRESPFPVRTVSFADHASELSWLLDDIRRDQDTYGLGWGEYAVLYRKHEIGDSIEAGLVTAGIPCQLAQGRALADDPVVAYVIATLRVIANPHDSIHKEQFLRVVLPPTLCAALQARADDVGAPLWRQVLVEANTRPRQDEDGRKLRRARAALRNLEALGRKHESISPLVEELLSQRVGEYRTVLEERYEELSDPDEDPYVVRLANRLGLALERHRPIWLPPMGGVAIALKGLLIGAGFPQVSVAGERPANAENILEDDVPSFGIALGTFKALQSLASRRLSASFRDFTAVDLETTHKDVGQAAVVDIAAVRVRDGRIVDTYEALINPGVPIPPDATATHGIGDADVATAPSFADAWPAFRAFCGNDVLVAHNGHHFDFPILRRLSKGLEGEPFCTYDTLLLARELHPTGRSLPDLAFRYGIDHGRSHRALADSRTLAQVLLCLEADRLIRARKTALVHLLDWLGLALALSNLESLSDDAKREEAQKFAEVTRFWTLGRYSEALDVYRVEREPLQDPTIPTVDDAIDRLGGPELMLRVRAERKADQRYPAAMTRLRRLLAHSNSGTLGDQIAALLELLALSRHDGAAVDRNRVNLLTLHSTKGLEFSRVYVVGVEDSELPGGTGSRPASLSEIEEARRVLYVGMTRAKDRLVLTRTEVRGGRPTGGHQFLTEMGLQPDVPTAPG